MTYSRPKIERSNEIIQPQISTTEMKRVGRGLGEVCGRKTRLRRVLQFTRSLASSPSRREGITFDPGATKPQHHNTRMSLKAFQAIKIRQRDKLRSKKDVEFVQLSKRSHNSLPPNDFLCYFVSASLHPGRNVHVPSNGHRNEPPQKMQILRNILVCMLSSPSSTQEISYTHPFLEEKYVIEASVFIASMIPP